MRGGGLGKREDRGRCPAPCARLRASARPWLRARRRSAPSASPAAGAWCSRSPSGACIMIGRSSVRPRTAEEGDHAPAARPRPATHVAREIGAADHVEDDVDAALRRSGAHFLGEVLGPVVDRRSAPKRRQAALLPSEPAVAKTRAPKRLASWIAVTPMPEVPPCTSTVSPAPRPAPPNRLAQTVKKVSGSAPRPAHVERSGHGSA